MQLDQAVIGPYAENLAHRIVQQVIRRFRKIPGESSGADSELKNMWEEMCVQAQGEQSIFWDVFHANVDLEIANKVKKLEATDRLALWLQTDEGREWYLWQQEHDANRESAPIDNNDIIEILWQQFLGEAEDYENDRICRYLTRSE